jgi:hypothetical protein
MMSFVPMKSRSRDLRVWFRAHPDLFVAERSGRQLLFWSIVACAMVAGALLVYLNPEETVELLGGRVKSGLAIAAVFALPPVIFLFSIAMILRRSQRWRISGGGVLTNPLVVGVDEAFPVSTLVAAIRDGREEAIVSALTAAHSRPGDDRIVTVFASAVDRVLYVAVLRVDGDIVWIDEEPLRVSDRAVDLKKLDIAARRASATGEGEARRHVDG